MSKKWVAFSSFDIGKVGSGQRGKSGGGLNKKWNALGISTNILSICKTLFRGG